MTITIRRAGPDDASPLLSYIQGIAAESNLYILSSVEDFNISVEQERRFLEEFTSADNSLFLLAQAEDAIVGVLSCQGGKRRKERHTVRLGISVHKDWRHRGVGRTLMERALEWAKQTAVVKRVELEVFVANAPAIHLYEKLGFQIEGRRRRAVCQDGQYFDILVMGLLL